MWRKSIWLQLEIALYASSGGAFFNKKNHYLNKLLLFFSNNRVYFEMILDYLTTKTVIVKKKLLAQVYLPTYLPRKYLVPTQVYRSVNFLQFRQRQVYKCLNLARLSYFLISLSISHKKCQKVGKKNFEIKRKFIFAIILDTQSSELNLTKTSEILLFE